MRSLALLLLLAASSCSFTSELEERAQATTIPISDVERVAALFVEAVRESDSDGSGAIQGLSEWVALVRTLAAKIRAL